MQTIPSESWTIKRITDYCKTTIGRWATEAWLLGKAFAIAKAKVTSFDSWKRQNRFSDSMVSRYMRLYNGTTIEKVKGLSVTQACSSLGIPISGSNNPKHAQAAAAWGKSDRQPCVVSSLRRAVEELGPACDDDKYGERVAGIVLGIESLIAEIGG